MTKDDKVNRFLIGSSPGSIDRLVSVVGIEFGKELGATLGVLD